MARRACVTANAKQLGELKELARSERRDEADRARAMLLSLEGLDQRGDRRRVRGDGGFGAALAGLVRERGRGGLAGGGRARTLRRARALRAVDRRLDPVGTGGEPSELDDPALAGRDRASGRPADFAIPAEHPAQGKRGLRWRRPRHSLTGRQDAEAVERVGLRLKLRRAQAEAGDIVLLFADESEALTHP